ncbi:MAG: ion channel [Lentisphaerales bacterium]|nr:ion channel [Lentisphaerales bacterium]
MGKEEGNNYSYVLAFLVLTLCTIPFRDLRWFGMDVVLATLHTALLVSAIYSCRHRPKVCVIVGILAVCSIIATWEHSIFAWANANLKFILGIIFYLIFTYVILEDVLKSKTADRNMLYGSLCAYILFGITFAFIYALLEVNIQGSFLLPETPGTTNNKEQDLLANFFYHSFVTLTTLGYGDIQPKSQPARFFCIIEAMIGQFYLVVVVAGIVGTTASKYFKSHEAQDKN